MFTQSRPVAQGDDPLGSWDGPGGMNGFDQFMDSILPPLDDSATGVSATDLAYAQGNGDDLKSERKRMKNNEAQRRLRVRKKVGSLTSKHALRQSTLLILRTCSSGASTATRSSACSLHSRA